MFDKVSVGITRIHWFFFKTRITLLKIKIKLNNEVTWPYSPISNSIEFTISLLLFNDPAKRKSISFWQRFHQLLNTESQHTHTKKKKKKSFQLSSINFFIEFFIFFYLLFSFCKGWPAILRERLPASVRREMWPLRTFHSWQGFTGTNDFFFFFKCILLVVNRSVASILTMITLITRTQAGDNHHFHPTCARCSKCGDPFGDGEEMYLQVLWFWLVINIVTELFHSQDKAKERLWP